MSKQYRVKVEAFVVVIAPNAKQAKANAETVVRRAVSFAHHDERMKLGDMLGDDWGGYGFQAVGKAVPYDDGADDDE